LNEVNIYIIKIRQKQQIKESKNNKLINEHISKGSKLSDNLRLLDKKVDNIMEHKPEAGQNKVTEKGEQGCYRFSETEASTGEVLHKRLDSVLFQNSNLSNKIYSKLVNLNDYIDRFRKEKVKYDDSLNKLMTENLDLKSVIAELEVKYKILSNKVNR
jgi:hypothetical protein